MQSKRITVVVSTTLLVHTTLIDCIIMITDLLCFLQVVAMTSYFSMHSDGPRVVARCGDYKAPSHNGCHVSS
jgi:hypothetical protein